MPDNKHQNPTSADAVNLMNSVHQEDWFIFAYANLAAEQHRHFHTQTSSEISGFLNNHDINSLDDQQTNEFIQKTKLYQVLDFEHNSLDNNAYSTFVLTQRLYFTNRELLNKIAAIRARIAAKSQDQRNRENSQNLDLELSENLKQLQENLANQVKSIEQEIVDLNQRSQAIEESVKAFEARGLIKHLVVKNHSNGEKYIELADYAENGAKNFNRIIELFLNIFHNNTFIFRETLVPLGALSSFFGLVAMLKACRPNEMGIHEKINFTLEIITKVIFVAKESLEITGFWLKALEPILPFMPIVSIIGCTLAFNVSISNIIKINLEHNEKIDRLNKLLDQPDGWLTPGVKLKPNAQKIKDALMAKLSVQELCVKTNPEVIQALFTHEEFRNLSGLLVKHATAERNKQLVQNVITASMMLILVSAISIMFFVPAVGPILGISLTLTLIVSFIARTALNLTVLKPRETVKKSELQSSAHYVPATLTEKKSERTEQAIKKPRLIDLFKNDSDSGLKSSSKKPLNHHD